MVDEKLPEELSSIKEGSIWCWGPLREYTKCVVKILKVEKKDDGNWWVLSRVIKGNENDKRGTEAWNEISRFVETSVIVSTHS